MRKRARGYGARTVKFAAPVMATVVLTAGAHVSAPPEPHLWQTASPYVLTATVDTSSTAAGIAESDFYYMSADELATAMDSLESLGVTQIRILVPWRNIEATEGEYDWSSLDAVVTAAAERGIATTASVTSTPTWASDYGYNVANGEPSDYSDYASFVSAVATRYSASANDGNQLISAYEVWNEPNGYLGWSPTPSAEDYTELLKAAYTAIKAADPDATVIGGVVGTGVSVGSDTINAVDFIEQMYAAGAGDYFDALSIHPYSLSNVFSDGTDSVDSAIEQVKEIRALMDANGDTDKLIWATEYGMPTTGTYTEATQSEYLQDFLAAWSTLTGVGPMFIYSLVDQNTGDGDIEDNWGLYTDDWTAKAAAAVLAAWLAANPTLAEAGYTPVFPTEDANSGNALTNFLKNLSQFVVSIKATIGSTFGAAWAHLTTMKVTFTALVNSVSSALSSVQTNIAAALNNVVTSVKSALSTKTAATTSATTESVTSLASAAQVTDETVTSITATAAAANQVETTDPAAETTAAAAEATSANTVEASAAGSSKEAAAVDDPGATEATDTSSTTTSESATTVAAGNTRAHLRSAKHTKPETSSTSASPESGATGSETADTSTKPTRSRRAIEAVVRPHISKIHHSEAHESATSEDNAG